MSNNKEIESVKKMWKEEYLEEVCKSTMSDHKDNPRCASASGPIEMDDICEIAIEEEKPAVNCDRKSEENN